MINDIDGNKKTNVHPSDCSDTEDRENIYSLWKVPPWCTSNHYQQTQRPVGNEVDSRSVCGSTKIVARVGLEQRKDVVRRPEQGVDDESG